MIKVAVVEDDKNAATLLQAYLTSYQKNSGVVFDVSLFPNGLEFISDYSADFDIVFMDIEMPGLNGIETAKKLRAVDENVCLIFVTNMSQYAISGYEVHAMDFLLKPVEYSYFAIKLEKALRYSEKHKDVWVCLPDESGKIRLKLSDIYFVESNKHYLYYHTKDKIYKVRDSMRSIEGGYLANHFALASNTCLVNMNYVTRYNGNGIVVNGEYIAISRSKKKEFADKLTTCLGGGII